MFQQRAPDKLWPLYSFENFLIDDSNKSAYKTAYLVAKNPGSLYNPLYIVGGIGLGKTHLLEAIGNFCQKEYEDFSIGNIPSDRFTNELISSLRNERLEEFREIYQEYDLLLMPGIQFFSGKNTSQKELVWLLGKLISEKKQIVLECDRYPQNLEDVNEQLLTQLNRSRVVEIHQPGLELRFSILNKIAASAIVTIPDEVISLLANSITDNIRDLTFCLINLQTWASLQNRKIVCFHMAKEAIKRYKLNKYD